MKGLINERVLKIKPYLAGFSKEIIAQKHGLNPEDIIKLSSNENPYGPSPKALEAIEKSADQVNLYPEDYPYDLIRAISNYVNHPPEMIIPGGNGSDEVLDTSLKMLIQKGDEVIIHPPTFSYYKLLVDLYGGKTVNVHLERDFSFSIEDIVGAISKKTKAVIICSPNNPTGTVISEKGLKEILDSGVFVILDEAYTEFAQRSLSDLLGAYDKLLVLRTFSKAFGLAGLRVGYGISNRDLVKEAMKIKPPHNVNLLAQRAATESLSDLEHLHESVDRIKRERTRIYKQLQKSTGLRIYPSQANFHLIDLLKHDADKVVKELEKKGIIVRGCRSFGLSNSIRVTVGTPKENDCFLGAFQEVLG